MQVGHEATESYALHRLELSTRSLSAYSRGRGRTCLSRAHLWHQTHQTTFIQSLMSLTLGDLWPSEKEIGSMKAKITGTLQS